MRQCTKESWEIGEDGNQELKIQVNHSKGLVLIRVKVGMFIMLRLDCI